MKEAPKTCAFVVDPTLIDSGAVAGDPVVPRPKKSRSFPAEITGTTPARTDVRDCLDEDVRPRIRLRPAAGEVDDVHPVAHGGLEGSDDLRACSRSSSLRAGPGR